MKQGILIITWGGGKEQFTTLFNSLAGIKYPILAVVNSGYDADWIKPSKNLDVIKLKEDCWELGAIETAIKYTDWDEIIPLQDTIAVKDIYVFDLLFNEYPNKPVAYNTYFQMYLGKLRVKTLKKLKYPKVRTKAQSFKEEGDFPLRYHAIDPINTVFSPLFTDDTALKLKNFDNKWGRKNLVLEDQFLIKRKGTWHVDQLKSLG